MPAQDTLVKTSQTATAGAQPGRASTFGNGGEAIRNLLRLLLKRRLLAGGLFVATVLAGIAYLLLVSPSYRASATLEIAREVVPIVSTDGSKVTSTVVDQEFYETQYGLLRGEALATDVVRKLRLASDPAFMGAVASDPKLNSAQRERLAVSKVLNHTSIAPTRMSRLVQVEYEADDTVTAARIANALATTYMDSNLTHRLARTKYAREFLAKRTEEVRRDLEASERRLAAYASTSQIISLPASRTDDGGAQTTASQSLVGNELATMSEALSRARIELAEAQARWTTAQSANGTNRPEVLQNDAITGLLQKRAELQSQAANMATNYDPDYPPLMALQAQIDRLNLQIKDLSNRLLQSVKADYDAAVDRETTLANNVERLKNEVAVIGRKSIEYNILQRDVETNRALYEGLLQSFKEQAVATDGGSNNVSLIMDASPLDVDKLPKPTRVLFVTFILGLLISIAAPLILEMIDTRIATPEEFRERFEFPLIGMIPAIKEPNPLDNLSQSKSTFSESYMSIHASLKFSTNEGAPRTLAVTSSRQGEGKTTTAIALAHFYSRQGERVLLIDGDLRRPSLHKQWTLSNEVGLSNLLSGDDDLANSVQYIDPEGFWVLTSGPIPPSPAELLAGSRFSELLTQVLTHFDRVIIDSPPTLGLADSPLIAAAANGVLFVVEANGAHSTVIRKSLQRLADLGGNIVGAILSKHVMRRSLLGDYDYYNYYRYGDGGAEAEVEAA